MYFCVDCVFLGSDSFDCVLRCIFVSIMLFYEFCVSIVFSDVLFVDCVVLCIVCVCVCVCVCVYCTTATGWQTNCS